MRWFSFNSRKSTQAAAFLIKLCGGQKDKYLLLKMLYLADRQALKNWENPITGDEPYSMEFGPVPSAIYDLTKGAIRHSQEWQGTIEKRGETLHLKSDPGTDEMSKNEMDVLTQVFQEFKDYDFSKMKDYSHKLPEFDESVGKSSRPILMETLLLTVGKSREQIERIHQAAIEDQHLAAIFGK